MNIYKILQKKRFNCELSSEEIRFLVEKITTGEVSREQAAAFLMASCINGLSKNETSALTMSMTNSGTKFDFKNLGKPVADKHSTGGVGDKLSLLLLPILLDLGCLVPMISGRGLGHTGGTIDKLESILGYRTVLTEDEIYRQMESVGGMIVSQSPEIAPADKIIYSIRDITATVESDGLITSSILSKKLAEGLNCLLLDLKIGNGAFYPTLESAKELIANMEAVAGECGLNLKIVPTNMDNPLGQNIGNWLEVLETEECLKGNFPQDLLDLTLLLASEMLVLAGIFDYIAKAYAAANESIESGRALDMFHRWISSQGGDLEASRKEYANTPIYIVKAKEKCIIAGFNTKQLGFAAIALKAGRSSPTDTLDFAAGIKLLKKQGDSAEENEAIAVFFARDTSLFEQAEQIFLEAVL